MAMVAAISSGRVQAHDDLVPVQPLAQYFWKACQVTFGQPFQFTHHFLAFVHCIEAMDPEHDLDLDL